MPTFAIEVGVVLERRKAKSPWLDVIWEAHAVLAEPASARPGASLGVSGGGELFYAGGATLEAHTIEAGYYRDNLATGDPKLWVVIRPRPDGPTPEVVKVTCDPTEGEGYTETGWETVNMVPMPEAVQAALAAFVDEHHVDKPFIKRKRDRQDPESLALGRKGPDRDRFLRAMQGKDGGS
jgi:hypothetical protein